MAIRPIWRLALGGVLTLAACGGSDPSGSPTPPTAGPDATSPVSTSAGATGPAGTVSRASTSTSAAPPTSRPGSTTPTTTTLPGEVQRVEIGRSVQGRPIVAVERGTPGGTVVLVIGVIHGDEDAGTAVVDRLRTAPLPAGIDLWLVESANPDGQANGTRTNANQVDLNRNFPSQWAPLGRPGDQEYAGTGPASEPETQAMVSLISLLQPDLALWYHQDLFRIAPGRGRAGEVRRRYAELTGLPVAPVTGGTYTGTAAGWQQRSIPDGVAFIVELGPELSADEADRHAVAVLALAEDPS